MESLSRGDTSSFYMQWSQALEAGLATACHSQPDAPRGRGTPKVTLKAPSWAKAAPLQPDAPIESDDIPALCGELLVLSRSLMHCASLAKKFKHSAGDPWDPELLHVWHAIARRCARSGTLISTITFAPQSFAWTRFVVSAKLDALHIAKLHKAKYTESKLKRRKQLAERLAPPSCNSEVFRLLRDSPQGDLPLSTLPQA